MTDGKWTCSTDEEHWNCDEEFDTEEEALSYLMSEHAPSYGVDDGHFVYVGQIKAIRNEDLAEYATPDTDRILDDMSEYLFENVGPDFAENIEASKEQLADLETRLKDTILKWMEDHSIKPTCYTLDHVKSHAWAQCKAQRSEDPETNTAERCVREIEHEGACEFP